MGGPPGANGSGKYSPTSRRMQTSILGPDQSVQGTAVGSPTRVTCTIRGAMSLHSDTSSATCRSVAEVSTGSTSHTVKLTLVQRHAREV